MSIIQISKFSFQNLNDKRNGKSRKLKYKKSHDDFALFLTPFPCFPSYMPVFSSPFIFFFWISNSRSFEVHMYRYRLAHTLISPNLSNTLAATTHCYNYMPHNIIVINSSTNFFIFLFQLSLLCLYILNKIPTRLYTKNRVVLEREKALAGAAYNPKTNTLEYRLCVSFFIGIFYFKLHV